MNAGHSTFHRPSAIQPGPALLAKVACLVCAWMASSCSWDSMAATAVPEQGKPVAVAVADTSVLPGACSDRTNCRSR